MKELGFMTMPLGCLEGADFSSSLEQVLRGAARRVIVISAYISLPAIQWVSRLVSPGCKVSIIARFSPSDVRKGASSFDAAKLILENNWAFGVLSNLHAKIYSVDDEHLYVGSANLTANGLMLYGRGNLECCVKAGGTEENLLFVKKIIEASSPVNIEQLSEMQKYLSKPFNPSLENLEDAGFWPESIIPAERNLWVSDFPWAPVQVGACLCEHDTDLFALSTTAPESLVAQAFLRSKSFGWLLEVLKKRADGEIYFGELSATLHSALSDDPSPYRQTIKQLLSNLLSYCRSYAQEFVRVDVPGARSERIRLFKSEGKD